MKKLLSSRLNKLIDILDYKETYSVDGKFSIEYIQYANLFCSVVPVYSSSYSEYNIAMQSYSKEYYIFIIRSGIEIRVNMRINYVSNLYEVKKIIEEDSIIKIVTIKFTE